MAAPPGASAALTPLAYALSLVLVLNVILGCFNLLPVPPLDGGGVLEGFLPERQADKLRHLTAAPGARLIGLLAVWFLFGRVIDPLFGLILRLVHPGLVYS